MQYTDYWDNRIHNCISYNTTTETCDTIYSDCLNFDNQLAPMPFGFGVPPMAGKAHNV